MRKIFYFILLLLIIVTTSCVENTGKGNLRIMLETGSQTKTLKPDDRSAMIVKYNVKGKGPGGKTFSKDSSSKSITIEGIPLGTWTVDAYGYNSDSVCIISGSKTFNFTNGTKSEQIVMNSFSGTGSLQVDLKWDKEITNPKLIIRINDSETIKPDKGTTGYTYINNSLAAGSYLMKVELYNGDTFTAGTVEAVQIVNNKTTSGTVSLQTPAKGETNSSTLSANTSSGHPLNAHFSLQGFTTLPYVVEAGLEQELTLALDSSLTNPETYQLTWYLNGQAVEQSDFLNSINTIKLVPTIGSHIVNAVVEDTQNQTLWSLYCKLTAQSRAKKGAATLVKEIKENNTNGVILAEDSLIRALPENHYVVVTPSRSSMQVISVVKNNVVLCSDQTYTAVDLRFTWLARVTEVYSNRNMNFFLLKVDDGEIHVLRYIPKTEKVDIALWDEEPLIFSGFNKLPPAFIDNVSAAALAPTANGAGTIFIFDSGTRSEETLSFETTDTEIKSFGTFSKGNKHNLTICADAIDGLLGYVEKDQLRYAKIQGATTSSEIYTFESDTLKNIKDFKILNSRYSVFSTKTGLRLYEYYDKQKTWVARTVIDTADNDFDISDDGAYIYIADTDKNLITYRSGLSDSFGKIHTQGLSYPITSLAVNTSTAIGKNTNNSLYIFEIAQEDSTL